MILKPTFLILNRHVMKSKMSGEDEMNKRLEKYKSLIKVRPHCHCQSPDFSTDEHRTTHDAQRPSSPAAMKHSEIAVRWSVLLCLINILSNHLPIKILPFQFVPFLIV